MTALLVIAVLVASAVQRLTGIGFAMLVAPFVVLALGPGPGVVLVNALGIVSAVLVMVRVRQDIHWPAVGGLLPSAAVGVLLGVVITRALSVAAAQIAAGAVIMLAVGTSVLVVRTTSVARTTTVTAVAGTASGLMGALAGVGGSAMAVLAILTRWEAKDFAATMQPYFALLGVITITGRLLADPRTWPGLSLPVWACLATAMVVGLVLGERVVPSPALARNVVVLLAGAGGLLAVVDGARTLIG